MKHKAGDKVRIIANIHDHEFDIGEVITIEYVNAMDYSAVKGARWYFTDEEIESATSDEHIAQLNLINKQLNDGEIHDH